ELSATRFRGGGFRLQTRGSISNGVPDLDSADRSEQSIQRRKLLPISLEADLNSASIQYDAVPGDTDDAPVGLGLCRHWLVSFFKRTSPRHSLVFGHLLRHQSEPNPIDLSGRRLCIDRPQELK